MRREIREVVKDKWVASPLPPRLLFPELKGSDTSNETQRSTTRRRRRQQANRITVAKGRLLRQAINFLTISIPVDIETSSAER